MPRNPAKKQPCEQGEVAHIGQSKRASENPMDLNIENQKWTVNQTNGASYDHNGKLLKTLKTYTYVIFCFILKN